MNSSCCGSGPPNGWRSCGSDGLRIEGASFGQTQIGNCLSALARVMPVSIETMRIVDALKSRPR